MPNRKISQFPTVTEVDNDDIFLINKNSGIDGESITSTINFSDFKNSLLINSYSSNADFYSLSAGSVLAQSYYTGSTSLCGQLANNTYFNLLTAMNNPNNFENPWLNYYSKTPKEVELAILNAETSVYGIFLFSNNPLVGSNLNSYTTVFQGKRYIPYFLAGAGNNTSNLTRVKVPVDSNGNLFLKILKNDPPTYTTTIYIIG